MNQWGPWLCILGLLCKASWISHNFPRPPSNLSNLIVHLMNMSATLTSQLSPRAWRYCLEWPVSICEIPTSITPMSIRVNNKRNQLNHYPKSNSLVDIAYSFLHSRYPWFSATKLSTILLDTEWNRDFTQPTSKFLRTYWCTM